MVVGVLGGGSTTKTYTVTGTQLKEGYTNSLAKLDKIIFSFGGENHSLEIKSIVGSLVNITLMSNPINFIIVVGQELKFDLDNNSFYDLMIKLNNITNNKANLTVQKINESIELLVEDGEETNESIIEDIINGESNGGKNTIWIYVSIIGLVIVVLVLIKFRFWERWVTN